MIHRITFKNFFSFKEEQVIDFTVNNNAPDSDAYVTSPSGARVGKLLGCFGHNASGKSNLLRAASFLNWFILGSHAEYPDSDLPFYPFLFFNDIEETSFKVDFETNNTIFRFSMRLFPHRILFEQLEWRKPEKSHFQYLFRREWNDTEKQYDITYNPNSGFRLPPEYAAARKRENASLLALAAQISEPISEEVRRFFIKSTSNLSIHKRRDSKPFVDVVDVSEFFNRNKNLFEAARNCICSWDLGLDDIDIRDLPVASGKQDEILIPYPYGIHNRDGERYSLPFTSESTGTFGLYCLLRYLLPILSGGGLAVIDAIDAEIHPHIIPRILEMFASKSQNPKNAQLIFSGHCTTVLSHMDKYQIVFVEKDDNKESNTWRLDEMKGLRAKENYFAKYNAGAYGAVPNL